MRRFSCLDHLPSTEDMIGTHGLPSCLLGFFTRRTLTGGKRMGFLTMMDATDCDFARRGRQFRMDGARISICSVLRCSERGPISFVSRGMPGGVAAWSSGCCSRNDRRRVEVVA